MAQFGKVGAAVIGWYLLSSVLAASIGTIVAFWLDPGKELAYLEESTDPTTQTMLSEQASPSLSHLLLSMFENPFSALAHGKFLAIIVFALTVINFGRHGPAIVGHYFSIALGVIIAILLMMFLVYPLMLALLGRTNPQQCNR